MSTPEKDADFHARVARTVGAVPASEVVQLRKDKERLDWLEIHSSVVILTVRGVTRVQSEFGMLGEGTSYRGAIDAAMNQPSP